MSALEHALAQIVEHHDARAAAETAKGFLVELGPGLRTGTKDQQADRLAAVAQRHDEQPSAPVLAAFARRAPSDRCRNRPGLLRRVRSE